MAIDLKEAQSLLGKGRYDKYLPAKQKIERAYEQLTGHSMPTAEEIEKQKKAERKGNAFAEQTKALGFGPWSEESKIRAAKAVDDTIVKATKTVKPSDLNMSKDEFTGLVGRSEAFKQEQKQTNRTFESVRKQYANNKYGKGNIDLTDRPIYKGKDGSISTVNSMSFNENGKEILIPTVVRDKNGNAKMLSDEEAIKHYHTTGEYLGKFNTVSEANKYAESLHNDQDLYYSGNKNYYLGSNDSKVYVKHTQEQPKFIMDDISGLLKKAIKKINPQKDFSLDMNADAGFIKQLDADKNTGVNAEDKNRTEYAYKLGNLKYDATTAKERNSKTFDEYVELGKKKMMGDVDTEQTADLIISFKGDSESDRERNSTQNLEGWTDKEKNEYYYIVGKYGAKIGQNYYNHYASLEPTRRIETKRDADTREWAKNHRVGGWLKSSAENFVSGINGVANAVSQIEDIQQNIDAPMNPNNRFFRPIRQSNAAYEGATDGANPIVKEYLLDPLKSATDNTMNYLFGNYGLVNMSLGAMTNMQYDATQRGVSASKAIELGVVSGLTEFATEKLGYDRISDLFSKSVGGSTAKTIFKQMAVNMIPESLEEMTSEIVNNATDMWISGDKSNYAIRQKELEKTFGKEAATKQAIGEFFIKNVLRSGAQGAIASVFMSAGPTLTAGVIDHINQKQIDSEKEQSSDNSMRYMQNATTDFAIKAAEQAMSETMKTTPTKAKTVENVHREAERISNSVNSTIEHTFNVPSEYGNTMTGSTMMFLSKPDNVMDADFMETHVFAAVDALSKTNSSAYKHFANEITKTKSVNNDSELKTEMVRAIEQYMVTGESAYSQNPIFNTITNSVKSVINKAVEMNSNAQRVLYGSNNADVIRQADAVKNGDYSALWVKSNQTADIAKAYVDSVDTMSARMTDAETTPETVENINETVDDGNILQIKTNDVSFKTESVANNASLGETSPIDSIISQGNNTVNSNYMENSENDTKNPTVNTNAQTARVVRRAKTYDTSRPGLVNTEFVSQLTQTERTSLDNLGKALNVPIVYTDQLPDWADGKYLDGVVYVSKNSVDTPVKVFAHEITHSLKETAPAEYARYEATVLDIMAKREGITIDELVSDKISEYADNGIELSEADAMEEITADFTKEFINNPESAESYFKKIQDKGVLQKLREIIRSLINKIKSAFNTDTSKLERAEEYLVKMMRTTAENGDTVNTGNDARFSFAGKNAKTANVQTLDSAKELEMQGVSNEDIYKQTGWFKGQEGKWKFEIDDSVSKMITEPNLKVNYDRYDGDVYRTGKLSDILEHDELFNAYPHLKDYNIIVQRTGVGKFGNHSSGNMGNYIVLSDELFRTPSKAYEKFDAERKKKIAEIEATPEYKEYNKFYDEDLGLSAEEWIKQEEEARNKFFNSELGKKYYDLNWGKNNIPKTELGWSKQAKSVLMHEIQHAIQEHEGFAGGSSPKYWESKGYSKKDAGNNYKNTAGEVEARDTSNRLDMSEEERRNNFPESAKPNDNIVFAEGNGVSYSLAPNAEETVEKVLNDFSYRDDVYLTENSPSIIASQKGVRNLPMVMKPSHVRENIFTEQEASEKGLKVDGSINYHGLGKEKFLEVVSGLDNVTLAYRGTKNAENPARRENYFLLFSQIKDSKGNTINVPVYINETGHYNRMFIDTNKIATVFGRENFREYINKEIKKGNLVRIKNRSIQASERTAPIAGGYNENASINDSVSQDNTVVNSNSMNLSEKYSQNSEKADGGRYSVNNRMNNIYDYSKSFSEQIDDYINGKIPKNDTLLVGGTPDVFKKIGLNSLPVTINQRHIDYALNGTKDLDHNLGKTLLEQLPESLKNPVAIFSSQTVSNRVVALLDFTVNGKQAIAPVEIDGFGTQNNISIDSNSITSLFGKGNSVKRLLNKALNDEIAGQKTLFYWNKKEAENLLRAEGLQLPSHSVQDGFIHSIRENGSPVNPKFENVTETQQFKRWFGDWQNDPEHASKVVNADGTPKVVYHGTDAEFWTFDTGRQGTGNDQYGAGFYFATDKDSAERYGNNVFNTYLEIRKPIKISGDESFSFDITPEQAYKIIKYLPNIMSEEDSPLGDYYEEYWESGADDWMIRDLAEKYTDIRSLDYELFRDYPDELHKAIKDVTGYDGVEVSFKNNGEKFYIAWFPNQIKSATDNIGTFDGSNDDIRYSVNNRVTAKGIAKSIIDEYGATKTRVSDIAEDIEAVRSKLYDTYFGKGDINEKYAELDDIMTEAAEKVANGIRTVTDGDMEKPKAQKLSEDDYAAAVVEIKDAILDKAMEAEDYILSGSEPVSAYPGTYTAGEVRAKVQNVRANERERANERVKNVRATERERARMRRDELTKKHRENKEEAINRIRERAKERADMERLRKLVKQLQKVKVPEAIKGAIPEIVYKIDTKSFGIKPGTIAELERIRDDYNKSKSDPDFIPDSGIEESFARLDKVRIASMDIEEVRSLIEDMVAARHYIQTYNKMIADEKGGSIGRTAYAVMDEVNNAKGFNQSNKFRGMVHSYFQIQKAPMRFARMITGYAKNSSFYKLFRDIQQGEFKMLEFQKKTAERFAALTSKKEDMRKFTGKNAERIDISKVFGLDNPLYITQDLRVYLALGSIDTDFLRHASEGGVFIPDIDAYIKGDRKTAFNPSKARRIKMTPSQIRAITDDMTPFEKEFVNEAYKYFNEDCKTAINETSVQLEGVERATQENYCPLFVSKNFVRGQELGVGTSVPETGESLKNAGRLKERVKSGNPVELNGIIDTIQRQSDFVSRYNGLAIPLENLQKVMNFISKNNGDSVRNVIENKWGDGALKYIDNLAKDIRGGRKNDDKISRFLVKVRGNNAQAVLTANPIVTAKQAASYPTAGAVVGFKPLRQALTSKMTAHDNEMMDKYTPLHWYRRAGYSTTELGDYAKYRVDTPESKAPWLLGWIQKADIETTRKLWKAAEFYVRNNNSDWKSMSEDTYYGKVAEVYNRIITETQPNYSFMERPEALRSNNEVLKAFTMFKTQPMQNFNLITDAIGEWMARSEAYSKNKSAENLRDLKEAHGKVVLSSLSLIVATAIISLLNIYFRNLLNHKKDEDNKIKKLLIDVAETVAGTFIGGNEFADLTEALVTGDVNGYYGINNPNLDTIVTACKSLISISKTVRDIDGENDDDYSAWGKALKGEINAIAALCGKPVKNISNMIGSIYNYTLDALDEEGLLHPGIINSEEWKLKQHKLLNNAFGAVIGEQFSLQYSTGQVVDKYKNQASGYKKMYEKAPTPAVATYYAKTSLAASYVKQSKEAMKNLKGKEYKEALNNMMKTAKSIAQTTETDKKIQKIFAGGEAATIKLDMPSYILTKSKTEDGISTTYEYQMTPAEYNEFCNEWLKAYYGALDSLIKRNKFLRVDVKQKGKWLKGAGNNIAYSTFESEKISSAASDVKQKYKDKFRKKFKEQE